MIVSLQLTKYNVVYNLRKNDQIVILDHKVMSQCRGESMTLATSESAPFYMMRVPCT